MTQEAATKPRLNIAIMVSGAGRGSNMMALIEGCATGEISGQVALIIGTRADAPALLRAQEAGIKTAVVSPRKYEGDEEGYGVALSRLLNKYEIGLICLAGYMRRLPLSIVSQFHRRIMNIHPALLPFFGGQGMYGHHVHEAVLASGMKVAGCTVHFVDAEYDTGPIIHQRTVPVLGEDTPETLAKRVLGEEHRAYVEAVAWLSEGRLVAEGDKIRLLNEKERDDS